MLLLLLLLLLALGSPAAASLAPGWPLYAPLVVRCARTVTQAADLCCSHRLRPLLLLLLLVLLLLLLLVLLLW